MPVLSKQHTQKGQDDLAYVPPPGAPPQHADATMLQKFLGQSVEPAPPAPPPRAADEAVAGAAKPAPADKQARPSKPRAAPIQPKPRAPSAPSDREDAVALDTGDEWWRQMLSEGAAALLLGVGPAAIDMACTVFGLTHTVLPSTMGGMFAATIIHLFFSIGQRHFLTQPIFVLKVLGLVLLVFNAGFNLYGIMPVVDLWFGQDVLGTIPRDPRQWIDAFGSAIWGWPTVGDVWGARWRFAVTANDGQIPSGIGGWIFGGAGTPLPSFPGWWMTALLLTTFCTLIAWRSEPNLAWWYLRAKSVWLRRP